jgi:hypocretin (orexin) receptor 2
MLQTVSVLTLTIISLLALCVLQTVSVTVSVLTLTIISLLALCMLQTVSVTVSVLTLTFISVDRWYAICFPLKFKSTTGRAKTAIIIIWLLALAFGK